MSDLKISLLELDLFWEDPKKNRDQIEDRLEGFPGSDILILPEMFTTGFSMNVEDLAEIEGEPSLNWMKKISKQYGTSLCGSIMVRSDEDKFFNRLYWVYPNGDCKQYDKRHLFAFAKEDSYFTAGSEKLNIEKDDWRILPLICYDLRFPVWSRNNSTSPYDLLIYIANWPQRRQSAWDRLLPARAIENACFVAGVNRTGKDGKGLEYSGGSRMFDYLGNSLEPVSNSKGLVSYEIKKEDLNSYRQKFPVLRDSDAFRINDRK
jgi:omega-amidase